MKNFVVIGLGRFGSALARELSVLGNEVIAVDRSEHQVNAVADEVTHAMTADIHDENVLRRIGVAECDCAIVAFASDIQSNILVTLLLKDLGVKKVIAKASNAMHVRVLQKIGADQIVFPEADMGKRMARILSSGRMLDYIDIGGEYKVAEVRCPAHWAGRKLRELDLRTKYNINVLLIKNNDRLINPSADYVIEKNDVAVIMGLEDDVWVVSNEK